MHKVLEVIVKVLTNVLLVPFFKWLGQTLREMYERKQHEKKLKEEIKKKVEAHEASNDRNSARDSFGKLP